MPAARQIDAHRPLLYASGSGVVPQPGVWAVILAGDGSAMSVPAFGSAFSPRGEKSDMR